MVHDVRCTQSDGAVGGGGGPGVRLPGWAVSLPAEFAAALRCADPPIVGRTEHGRCLLDLRCVAAADDGLIAHGIRTVAARLSTPGGAPCT